MTGSGKAAMLTIFFRVDAKPGKRKELIDFLEWNQKESVQKERGTLRFDFFQDPEMADRFYVYEAYEDRLPFEEHQKHKPYKRWRSRVFSAEGCSGPS